MAVRQLKNNPLFFGFLSLMSAGLAIYAEIGNGAPRYLAMALPVVLLLVVWNLYVLCGETGGVLTSLSSPKKTLSLVTLTFFILLTCTPALYLSHSFYHPFRDIPWLIVSAIGLLFSLAFLNYSLTRPGEGWLTDVPLHQKIRSISPSAFLLCAACWMFMVASCFSYTVFGGIPHVQDAIAQLFQAKIFMTGSLTAPPPPIPDFFQYFSDNIIINDRWYSQYPPGYPFFLMFGIFLGAPWIVNPIFAALSTVLLYKCALSYYDEDTAYLATIFYCISPFVLFMSASFMNHASALFFILLSLYTLRKSLEKKSLLYALVCGCALGVILTIRTGEGIALSIPLGIYFLMCCVRQQKTHLFICFAFSFLGMLVILLTYNYLTNGDPLLFGYQVRWGREHTLGFSAVGVINEPAHTPGKGMLNTLRNMIALNQNLFEWPLPSLIPLYLLATPFLFKKNVHDYLFLCCLLAAPAMYFFYFYQDLCLGPRFYYISLPFIFMVTATSIFNSIGALAQSKGCDPHKVKNVFLVLFCFYLLFAAFIRVPKLYRYYSDSFWFVDNHIMKKAREMKLDKVLIFLKGTNPNGDDLGSGFLYNSPRLNDPIVFARDLGQRNQELLPFFPEREYYVATRDAQGNVSIDTLQPALTDEPKLR